jgi:hypothetical protein
MFNTSKEALEVIQAMSMEIPIVKRSNRSTASKWEDIPYGERPDWDNYIYAIRAFADAEHFPSSNNTDVIAD